jgi:hypothetical protein
MLLIPVCIPSAHGERELCRSRDGEPLVRSMAVSELNPHQDQGNITENPERKKSTDK